jgi:hypothetical protein
VIGPADSFDEDDTTFTRPASPARTSSARSTRAKTLRRGAVIVIGLALVLVGCSEIETRPDREPNYRGSIASIDARGVLVQHEGDECGRVLISEEPETRVFRATESDKLEPAEWRDLQVGDAVSVWTDEENDSCPGQASVLTIILENTG